MLRPTDWRAKDSPWGVPAAAQTEQDRACADAQQAGHKADDERRNYQVDHIRFLRAARAQAADR